MASRPARRKPPAREIGPSLVGIETRLHGDCVKAGAAAALQLILDRLPLLKPLLPATLRRAGAADSVDGIQRRLIASIYRGYGLKPAVWELEGILAVAQTQGALSPLASRSGLKSLLRAWLPDALSAPLLSYTPLEPLVVATGRAVAATWAAGRYADSVCRLRKAGADWLPAPLADALNLAPSTLRAWSGEALALAMPPLRLANALGKQFAELTRPASATATKSTRRRPAAKKPRAQ